MINKTHVITIEDIYGEDLDTLSIYKGYKATAFRPPKKKEWFKAAEHQLLAPVQATHDYSAALPRIILEKIDVIPGLTEHETKSLRENLKTYGFDKYFEPVERRIIKKGDFYCTPLADWVKRATEENQYYTLCDNYVILKEKKND